MPSTAGTHGAGGARRAVGGGAAVRPAGGTALSVHGPHGVLDLTVPDGATLADVARTYAAETGSRDLLPLVDRSGSPLQMTTSIAAAGLVPGAVLVAVDPAARPAPPRRRVGGIERGDALRASAASAAILAGAAVAAVLAGWTTSRLPADERWPYAALLLAAALLGALPLGVLAGQRVLAAPAFAAGAAFALTHASGADRLPLGVGVAALAAAVAAALGRALADPEAGAEEGLRVWIVTGVLVFAAGALATLTSTAPSVVWAVLLLVAVLAARFVPEFAVDVPDTYLLDLERLAVTAWSARERPAGRRGRAVVAHRAVVTVAARGTRLVDAASVAVLATVAMTAPLLLATAPGPVDRIGALCLTGFGGATLLLGARNFRHARARALLRLAGLVALGSTALALLGLVPGVARAEGLTAALPFLGVPVAAALVLVGVVVGRGWRSAWWARRAEVAEAVCGSAAVASLVVAVGLFRHLWEVTG